MLYKVFGASCLGIDTIPVTIEVDVTPGMAYVVVGLPDNAVRESQHRIMSALHHYGYKIPGKRVVVNLAPADLKKAGTGFDLGITTGILAASGQLEPVLDLSGYIMMGELALDGSLRHFNGALAIAADAAAHGLFTLDHADSSISQLTLTGMVEYGTQLLEVEMREGPAAGRRFRAANELRAQLDIDKKFAVGDTAAVTWPDGGAQEGDTLVARDHWRLGWMAVLFGLFSLLLVVVRKIDARDRFYRWCGKASAPIIILLGVLVWAGSQSLIMNPRAESLDGLYNLYKPLAYFIPFLLGYFVFSHDAVQEKVERMRLPMLLGAVAACVALVWTTWGTCNTDPQYLAGWLNCLYAWLMILAMMGCFKAWFDRTDRFCGYMARSSFGIYIVHYLIVAAPGYMLKLYTPLAPWAMYAILLAAVLLLSPALYELLRRIPFVRWCVLGINHKRQPES